jgi:hypothetical protein
MSRSSAGVARVTTRPFLTSYEFAPTFMVVAGYTGRVELFFFDGESRTDSNAFFFCGEEEVERRRSALNALARLARSPLAVSYNENTKTGKATSASRIIRLRSL